MITRTLLHVCWAVLPLFLAGALGTVFAIELGVTDAQLGLAVGSFFGASALSSVLMSQFARLWRASLFPLIGWALTAAGFFSMGVFTQSWRSLTLSLVAAGLGNGIVHPVFAYTIADWMLPARHGLAFGVKQAAVPIAGVIAGVALPITLRWVDWRLLCVVGGAVSTALVMEMARFTARLPEPTRPAVSHAHGRGVPSAYRSTVTTLAVGGALGVGGGSSAAVFLVGSAVAGGVSLEVAGLLFSACSIGSAAVRLAVGWFTDRMQAEPTAILTAMILLGGLGCALLGIAGSFTAFAVGGILAFSIGWGWTGVLDLMILRSIPEAPAAASGLIGGAMGFGGLLGPSVFGWLAQWGTHRRAWFALCGCMIVGAIAIMLTGRRAGTALAQDIRQ